MKIEGSFFSKKDVFVFLVCVIVFAVLFILVYDPIGAEGVSDGMVGDMPENLYLGYLVATGFVLLGISRTYMYRSAQKRDFTFWGYLLWNLGEVVVISFVLSRLSFHIRPMGGLTYMRLLLRVIVDVLSVLFIPYMLATLIVVLRNQKRRIDYLTELAALQEMAIDESPKRGADEVLSFLDRGGRFAFSTRKSNVLYVESADNYCNIHYDNNGKVDFFILHNSMKNVSEAYAEKGFVRCHRCYLVNLERIKALKKSKDGLLLELSGIEKSIPVSKTYASDVMAQIEAK